jgi:quinol monooxygenase YgiN
MNMVSAEMIINDSSKRDEVIDLLTDINQVYQSGKDGCIVHDFYVSIGDPNRIRLYTESESHEATLAAEENPTFQKLVGKIFEYQESGVLTMDLERLRRYHLDNPMPPMVVQ